MSDKFFNIPTPILDVCLNKALKAKNSWITLENEFIAENIALGITASNKTKLIADALMYVMQHGRTGSLWEAYKAINQVNITPEMAPYLTKERMHWMRNRLIAIISTL